MHPMPTDVEAEICDIKRRISELEGPSGFLTRQVQGVHKDLLSFAEAITRFAEVDHDLSNLSTTNSY